MPDGPRFAGHRAILADAGLKAMSLDNPQTVDGL